MNLSHKFILVLLTIVVSIVSLLTYLNIQEDKNILNSALEKRFTLMKKNLTQNAHYTIAYYKDEIENDLASMNLSHIVKILKQLVDRDEIEGAALINEDKSMQLFEGRPYQRQVKELTTEETKNNIIIATPIALSKHWGTLTLVYTLDPLHQEILEVKDDLTKKIEHKIVYATILGVVIFILFAIFSLAWAKRLTSPLLVLTDTAKKIANTEIIDNNALQYTDRQDEVGVLTNAFCEMSTKLQNSYRNLKELNESLEEKIKERTKDLEIRQEELKILAATDSMTKLYNRRYFTEMCIGMFSLENRMIEEIGVIMLDIDNFKYINDTYGHQQGDKVIIFIANLLREHTRKSDVICRFGGEEFILLLPHTSLQYTIQHAENIRSRIASYTMDLGDNKTLSVTVSVGVSMVNHERDIDMEDAIKRTDRALYEAKNSGKNRVVISDEKA
jgi:diguanylate cyclase (GGDEF)-like protein